MISLTDFLIVSAGLFSLGLFMIVSKRNAIQILIALFAIVLAAATTAVALAIILNVYRRYKTIDPAKVDKLRD